MVSVPMYLKKSVGRTIVQHPTRVASIMIRNELIELGILGSTAESPTAVQDFLKSDEELGDLYERHCITIEALRQGFKREHIVPLSVYFDGVQYSKNENFLGVYVTNLRTKKQRLVWVLSTSTAVRNLFVFIQVRICMYVCMFRMYITILVCVCIHVYFYVRV